jgi:uncharacterized protein YecE (DUF72 family)
MTPREAAQRFDSVGTHLRRYSGLLSCAEVNSSFHRPHSAAIYGKWRESTPKDFRFAVKVPRMITHELRLQDARDPLTAFLSQTDALREKRGPLLVQLPPSLSFDGTVASAFLDVLRSVYEGLIALEPRHPTWFTLSATALLDDYRISRVAADPSPVPSERMPGGWTQLAYFRMHGSPHKYWSRYDLNDVSTLATTARGIQGAEEVWCIFDNTASGAAIENALELRDTLSARSSQSSH